jgi:hypothetical protein
MLVPPKNPKKKLRGRSRGRNRDSLKSPFEEGNKYMLPRELNINVNEIPSNISRIHVPLYIFHPEVKH